MLCAGTELAAPIFQPLDPMKMDLLNPNRKKTLCGTVLCLFLAGTAQATVYDFIASLSGPAESPPVPSPGTGTATVQYDSVAHTLLVTADFQDLVGTTTVAHIHAVTPAPFSDTAGVATYPTTFPGFPAGVTSGNYISPVIDLTLDSSFTGGFLGAHGGTAAGAEAALLDAMLTGRAYFNIHSSFSGSGEIRGFLTRVPDTSSTATLLVLSTLGMIGLARYRRC
jgi:hypothetical protein